MTEELYNLKKKGVVFNTVLSLVIPGLGQLYQRKFIWGIFLLVLSGVLWLWGIGWIVNIGSAIDSYLSVTKSNKILKLELETK